MAAMTGQSRQYRPPSPGRPPGRTPHGKATFLNMLDGFLRKSIQDYFDYVHPLFPITDPESVDARFNQKEHLYDKPFAGLMLSIAALPLVLPNREAGSEGRVDDLLDEAISMHNTAELGLKPTLECVATAMNIGALLRVRKGANASHLRFREAIGLVELLSLSHPSSYDTFSFAEKEVALRIFWLLAAVER